VFCIWQLTCIPLWGTSLRSFSGSLGFGSGLDGGRMDCDQVMKSFLM
jgi:hypothetical protein